MGIEGLSAGEMLRQLREQRGLSQRALARLADVDAATVGKIEAGRLVPGWHLMQRLAAAGNRSLGLNLPDLELDLPGRKWLYAGTSERLFRSMGGRAHPRCSNRLEAWNDLGALARNHVVVLEPVACRGIWLPDVPAPSPLPVTIVAVRWGGSRCVPAVASRWLTVQTGPAELAGLLPLGVTARHDVLVWPPSAPQVASDAAEGRRLRAVATVLHEQAARDAQHRRLPPHRTSDPVREDGVLMSRKQFRLTSSPGPDARDRRDFRLGGASSFETWLARERLRPG